jgi:2-succinyl-6-hydroxy-2,4-cyclohexadiene-1-carboxylate synthase
MRSVERPLVVFVPGFMQRGSAWDPVARRVAERYPTLCVESVAEVPAGAVAVGYSMGGRLVLRRAVDEPDAFAAVAIVGTGAGIEDARAREARRSADEGLARWMEGTGIEQVVARWETQAVFADQSPALVEAQRPGRLSHDPAELARTLRELGQGAMDPFWDRIPSLTAPLLAMAGEADARYVAAAERLASLAPDGRVAVIADAGHAPQLQQPAAVATELLAFIDGALPRP